MDHVATGAFLKDPIAKNLAAIEKAAQLANESKVVTVNYWAGPIVGFEKRYPGDHASGLPVYAAHDPHNHAPNGTLAQVYAGWQQRLKRWLPFNLAMFLSVAGPSTYFTQMVWYASFQGFVPCPKAPVEHHAPIWPQFISS